MASVTTNDGGSIYKLNRWLGLNESPDGDTGLKAGEAALMRNFRITREGHLQVRPGYAAVCSLGTQSVRGLWRGFVKEQAHLLAACGGHLWDVDTNGGAADLGEIQDGETDFFGFEGKVYLLTGSEYYCWDGEQAVAAVEGYVPLVVTAAPPAGGGTLLERVNLLTGKRRARFSPDGAAAKFQLPETDIDEVIGVEGTDIAWTANLQAGTVTFSDTPAEGVNTVTVTWRKGSGQRSQITAMRFAEIYNGATDARVFLYGDGTNQTLYSDLDENGRPTAEYFPDLNCMAVDSANTPITAMIRHYDRLLVCKSDSTYVTRFDTVELSGGTVTAALYTIPVNREIGCAAPGQARLVENSPRTPFGRSVYSWSLAGGASRDERNAKRISHRVENTLSSFDLSRCVSFDDERRQEYYLCCDGQALIHNYGSDTWYYYDHFPVTCMAGVEGEVYFGTQQGQIMHLSRNYRNDALEPIDAYWESGAMDFGQDWRYKYAAELWVTLKPESQARLQVSAQSDRKSDHAVRDAAAGLTTLSNVDFGHWSFRTNRKPKTRKVRLRVKRFNFLKLIFSSCSASATATVLGADLRLRSAGRVR